MKKTLLLLLFLFPFISSVQAMDVDSLLNVLDASIKDRPAAFEEKENRIFQLKESLFASSSGEEQYNLLTKIVEEYSYYKIDSAVYYSDQCIEVASLLNREDCVVEYQLKRIYFFTFLRLFHESFEQLEAIDFKALPVSLQKEYLRISVLVYHNSVRGLDSDYVRGFYDSEILKACALYFEIEKEETYDYLSLKAYVHFVLNDFRAAEEVVLQILAKEDLSVYQRAETLFNLGGIYLGLGESCIDEAEKALIEAAILCNKHAITRNPPLLQLALIVSEEDYFRAYNYINLAIEDAAIFSVDHKVGVREKTYNEVQNIYYQKIKKQKLKLQVFLVVNVVLSFALFSILIIMFRANGALRKIRKKLVHVNSKMKESNRIKEVYISYFLNQYSNYIDKITESQRHILRLINAGHSTDTIKKEALSSINTKDDLNDFFSDFDKSILELFPSFVQEVNLLLRPEEAYKIRISQKGSVERLNTELRVLALLRLGISDNKEIASFFRFTVQTVYNYRSKAKLRAIDEDSFEEKIKNICKYEL